MSKDVVVTGLGPISCIGKTTKELWENVVKGFVGIERFNNPGIAPETTSLVAAFVKDFNFRDYTDNQTVLSLLDDKSSRAVQLGIAAAIQAIKDAGIDLNTTNRERVGGKIACNFSFNHLTVFVGTLGNVDYIYEEYRDGNVAKPQAAFLASPATIAALVSSMLDIRGPADTLAGGCPSGMDSLGFAARCISTGVLDVAIVIGADNEATPLVFNTIAAANGLSSQYNDEPKKSSRPFDKNRGGNVLGENACGLVIESKSHAIARKAPQLYSRVAGYAKTSAGTRVYSHDKPSLVTDAVVRAINAVLRDAGWKPSDVDLFCANGSASKSYDKLEAHSLVAAFGPHVNKLHVNSIKGMTGQSGAGCTVVQIAAACLCLYYKKIYGTVNFDEQDPNLPVLNIVKKTQDAPYLQRIVCHALNLGGFQYSCLALEAISNHSKL